jgi:hypothetical protein
MIDFPLFIAVAPFKLGYMDRIEEHVVEILKIVKAPAVSQGLGLLAPNAAKP